MSEFKIKTSEVKLNVEQTQAFMKSNELDALYISSFDPYLNEYVPMINCLRYYLSGFSGSMAELLVLPTGKVKLYVDGRYHEQADLECDLSLVEVVKVPQNVGVLSSLESDLHTLKVNKVGVQANRTATSLYERLKSKYEVKAFFNQEIPSLLNMQPMPALNKIKHLPREHRGSDTSEKIERILTDNSEAYFITAIDSLAWLTNCRGYHLPNLSSFLGCGLLTKEKVYVFVDHGVDFDCKDESIEFIHANLEEISSKLSTLKDKITRVYIDKGMLNAAYYQMLEDIFSVDKLESKPGGLVEFHSVKEAKEMEIIRDSFKRADKAIYNTIMWAKNAFKENKKITERDLYNQTTIEYKKQGALEQSFNTIAGVGPNSSIMHYSDPKDSIEIEEGLLCLLDSGGYFEAGFATDTTRCFVTGDKIQQDRYKEIYTYVLKGTLNLQNAVFKPGTRGGGLDAICRQPLFQGGYDFAHGTGHGVGIHVHEGGVGISPVRNYLMKPGQVVSLEPGIYFAGFGGVRLENIAQVIEHPKYEGFLCFEPLVYIGFEPQLIDMNLLNAQEKIWLEEYEEKCVERGTSFRI